jgi:hypothetical protein
MSDAGLAKNPRRDMYCDPPTPRLWMDSSGSPWAGDIAAGYQPRMDKLRMNSANGTAGCDPDRVRVNFIRMSFATPVKLPYG